MFLAPSTPSHLSGHRMGGPGLGVRLDSHWSSSKMSPYSQLSTPDRELLKLEKFKFMLQSPNVNLGTEFSLCVAGFSTFNSS